MPKGRPLTIILTLLVLLAGVSSAQTGKSRAQYDPVQWSLQVEPDQAAPGQRVVGRLTADIEDGWRLYAPSTPKGGPIPTELKLAESAAIESWKVYQPKPKTKMDPNFQMETQTYDKQAVFLFDITLNEDSPSGPVEIESTMRYNACNDRLCLPPVRKSAAASLDVSAGVSAQAPAIPSGYTEAKPGAEVASAGGEDSGGDQSTAASAPGAVSTPTREGFIQFAMIALGFGFLAIFTPCVFPMIPITMSYFVSTDTGSRRDSVIQAFIFCGGVILSFTGLGALVAAILGPFGLTQLGTSVWVNLFIAVVFIVFGLSLLGLFEISVPSSTLTSLNKVSDRGGLIGTLVMGLVFALASFACTGPFIGALLAGSIQGNLTWPIFGMLMFSIGLATPFFFLALFPAYLKKMPKSGGWLARTKNTMAFLIFAAALKYLSNVDQIYQWEILTRERYLAIWIVLMSLAGLYSLGIVRIGEDEKGPIGVGRLILGAVFLVFAVMLIPGMFGGHLGELEAYVPSTEYSGLTEVAFGGGSEKEQWLKNDYEKALRIARETGKPILISFTGYTCTNCHWMKANMFTKPEIEEILAGLVLLELYTDGADAASEQNQKFQLERFETVAIPYYAIIKADETVVAEFPGRTRNVEEFRSFLSSATSTQLARAQ